MSWADKQIKKDRDEQESQKQSDELRLRDQRLKDEVGKEGFEKVKAYIKAEVEKYAKHSTAGKLLFFPDTSVEEEQDFMSKIPSFSIVNQGRNSRMYVKYSESRHALVWKCGYSEGVYRLSVNKDGACYFVGDDGKPRSPEQLGDELLDMVMVLGD